VSGSSQYPPVWVAGAQPNSETTCFHLAANNSLGSSSPFVLADGTLRIELDLAEFDDFYNYRRYNESIRNDTFCGQRAKCLKHLAAGNSRPF
jgi:hypothetical protein